VQAVRRTRFHESRHSPSATIDQNTPQADRVQRSRYQHGAHWIITVLQFETLDITWQTRPPRPDHKTLNTIINEAARRWRHAPMWIKYDTCRIAAFAPTHGKRWIISLRGPNTNNHSIHMGAQAVQMVERGITVDPPALARDRCDAAIERLPELSHDKWLVGRRIENGQKHIVVAGPPQTLDRRPPQRLI